MIAAIHDRIIKLTLQNHIKILWSALHEQERFSFQKLKIKCGTVRYKKEQTKTSLSQEIRHLHD